MALIPEFCDLDRKLLGRLLRAVREEAALSVREVAKHSRLDNSYLSKVEMGLSEISVRRFVRLCYTLAVPPGLLSETCATISDEIYRVAFLNDEEVKRHASLRGHLDDDLLNKITDFLTGTALVLAYLMRASNPLLMLATTHFPVPRQRAAFIKFAQEILPDLQPTDRRHRLFLVIASGWKALREIELAGVDCLDEYVVGQMKEKKPWRPAPRLPVPGLLVEMANPLKTQVQLLIPSVGKGKRNELTNAETSGMSAAVKPQLPTLLARLNQAAQETGKMSALAQYLSKRTGHRVPLASVSRWLSGKREPGGEITLLLQQWVNQEEARQK